MSDREKLIKHIDNIEQDFKVLDNIFKCMNIYWRGESALAVIDTYKSLDREIMDIRDNMTRLRESVINEMED